MIIGANVKLKCIPSFPFYHLCTDIFSHTLTCQICNHVFLSKAGFIDHMHSPWNGIINPTHWTWKECLFNILQGVKVIWWFYLTNERTCFIMQHIIDCSNVTLCGQICRRDGHLIRNGIYLASCRIFVDSCRASKNYQWVIWLSISRLMDPTHANVLDRSIPVKWANLHAAHALFSKRGEL